MRLLRSRRGGDDLLSTDSSQAASWDDTTTLGERAALDVRREMAGPN
jgi:hypothetical protein